jgi:hypothetical protein
MPDTPQFFKSPAGMQSKPGDFSCFNDETFQNRSKLQFNSSMPNSGKISVEALSKLNKLSHA